MDKKSNPISMQDAIKMANSDAGQQLLTLLKAQNSDALNAAMTDAASGDYSKAKEHLSAMLSSPQVQALLEQLRRNGNG